MPLLKVSEQGDVTLDKETVASLGAKPGDELRVEKFGDGRMLLSVGRPAKRIEDLFGSLKGNGRQFSIKEINDAIARGWAGERE